MTIECCNRPFTSMDLCFQPRSFAVSPMQWLVLTGMIITTMPGTIGHGTKLGGVCAMKQHGQATKCQSTGLRNMYLGCEGRRAFDPTPSLFWALSNLVWKQLSNHILNIIGCSNNNQQSDDNVSTRHNPQQLQQVLLTSVLSVAGRPTSQRLISEVIMSHSCSTNPQDDEKMGPTTCLVGGLRVETTNHLVILIILTSANPSTLIRGELMMQSNWREFHGRGPLGT